MRWTLVPVALVASATLAGCSAAPSATGTRPVTLTVFAAASLTNVFPRIGELFTAGHPDTKVVFSFGGTDSLVAQIEQGVPADVFAGASKKYADKLWGERLIDGFSPMCTNQLVLVVPPSNPSGISTLEDLTRHGIKLVVGSVTVPVGSYTRTVLSNLDGVFGAGYSSGVLANVVSNENDVEGVLSKVESGEADAGFVYLTDSIAAGSAVKAITLPASAQALATYPIAAIKASKHGGLAQLFVDLVLSAPAQAILRAAGFGPPAG